MGTGGGSGLPENYVVWQERDETTIAGYIPQIAADLYLTVVHMCDHMYDYLFVMSHKQLSKEARVDIKEYDDLGCSDSGGDYSDVHSILSRSVSSTTSKKHSFDDSVRAISTVVEKFREQREIANKKVINDLISAFSASSPKQNNQVNVAESDQGQKLVDQIHSTNHTISIFKNEVDNLKKKREKAIEISKPRKAQKYSKEIADKENIIETLYMALSRHAEELKTISSSGCNNVVYNNTNDTKKSNYESDESTVELDKTE